jgi:16S rRNA (adenine1518-N6/adenine1519-N6)-dimethyltransferase
MIQKEVAERVAARPGKMNLLAAATQVWADVEILFTLPATDFEPAPEVNSGVVRLKVKGERLKVTELIKYYEFIHKAFKQPRKTLLNNLVETQEHKNIKTKEQMLLELKKFGFNEKTRAQELGINQLIELSGVIMH